MSRVLQVLGRSAGGIATHVAQLTEALDGTDGFSIDVAAPTGLPLAMPKRVQTVNIPNGPVRGHRGAVATLRRTLRTGRYDIAHAHGLRAGIDAALAARTLGLPVLLTVHNLVRVDVTGVARAPFYRQAEKVAVYLADRSLAVSEDIARHLRRVAPRAAERVEVLYLGITPQLAPARSRSEVRTELGLSPNERLIVTASRLSPQKALHVLLEALAQTDAAVLAVLGEGPLETDLRQTATALGVSQRVRWLGFRHDPADFIAAADVFCLSSVWEGIPLAAQEAILLGTPVVATRVGGMPELVSDGVSGRLVPPRDATALAKAIAEVTGSDELRAAYTARAKEDLLRRFSTERMLDRLATLYRAIAR